MNKSSFFSCRVSPVELCGFRSYGNHLTYSLSSVFPTNWCFTLEALSDSGSVTLARLLIGYMEFSHQETHNIWLSLNSLRVAEQ